MHPYAHNVHPAEQKRKKYRSQKKMASTNALTNAFTPKRHIKKLFATDDRRQTTDRTDETAFQYSRL